MAVETERNSHYRFFSSSSHALSNVFKPNKRRKEKVDLFLREERGAKKSSAQEEEPELLLTYIHSFHLICLLKKGRRGK